jgi:CheY-like chemotaxis protein
MNGYDVAKRLRQDANGKDARIVAVSGYGQEEDHRQTKAGGFDNHLVKPIGYEELSSLLGPNPDRST